MKSLILLCSALTLVTVIHGQSEWQVPEKVNSAVNPYSGNEKATEKGRKIYSKLCWSCHGKTGLGDGPAAANLEPAPANYNSANIQSQTDGSLFWKITKGKGSMAPYESTLSEEQRWMLVNYIRKLGEERNGP